MIEVEKHYGPGLVDFAEATPGRLNPSRKSLLVLFLLPR
jgi:hypothetical protein